MFQNWCLTPFAKHLLLLGLTEYYRKTSPIWGSKYTIYSFKTASAPLKWVRHDFEYIYQRISNITHLIKYQMKNSNLTLFIPVLMYALLLSSCTAIADIFKAGMGFGIFLVVAVIGLIIFFISRAGKGGSN